MKIKLLALAFLNLTLFASDQYNLINSRDIWDNYLECTQDFKNYYSNDNNLDRLFPEINLSQEDRFIIKKIFSNYCDANRSLESTDIISKNIFESNSNNKVSLYSLHTYQFRNYAINSSPRAIHSFLLNQFFLITQNLDEKYFTKRTWLISLINLSWTIDAFDLSKFSDKNEDPFPNHDSETFAFWGLLENILINSINSRLGRESLELLSRTLLDIRVARLYLTQFFASSSEKYALREEFINIYMNDFEELTMRYHEVNEIIIQKEGINNSDLIFNLKLSLDQAIMLHDLSIPNIARVEITNSRTKYLDYLDQVLVDYYDQNPKRVLNSLLLNTRPPVNTDNYCPLISKEISTDSQDISLFDQKTILEILKYHCTKEITYLVNAVAVQKDLISNMPIRVSFDKLELNKDLRIYLDSFGLIWIILDIAVYEESFVNSKQNKIFLQDSLIDYMFAFFKNFDVTDQVYTLGGAFNLNQAYVMFDAISGLQKDSAEETSQILKNLLSETRLDLGVLKQAIDQFIDDEYSRKDIIDSAIALSIIQSSVMREIDSFAKLEPYNNKLIKELEALESDSPIVRRFTDYADLSAKSALSARVSLVFHFKTPGKRKFRNQIAFLVFSFRK